MQLNNSQVRESVDGYQVYGYGWIADISRSPISIFDCWHVRIRDAVSGTLEIFAMYGDVAKVVVYMEVKEAWDMDMTLQSERDLFLESNDLKYDEEA